MSKVDVKEHLYKQVTIREDQINEAIRAYLRQKGVYVPLTITPEWSVDKGTNKVLACTMVWELKNGNTSEVLQRTDTDSELT